MAIRTVQLGTPRRRGEGVRLGTVRRPPRGVRKADYTSRNYFDVWMPELAPAALLMSWAHSQPWTSARWTTFARRYRSQMQAPAAGRLIALLAALSRTADFSIGCYCQDASRCHRTLLRELLEDAGASLSDRI